MMREEGGTKEKFNPVEEVKEDMDRNGNNIQLQQLGLSKKMPNKVNQMGYMTRTTVKDSVIREEEKDSRLKMSNQVNQKRDMT